MTHAKRHVVVVGGSVAGMRVLAELRAAGFGGRLTLVDPDAGAPYDRPPLSKQVLVGDWPPNKASLGDPSAWGAEIVERRAIALDAEEHVLTVEPRPHHSEPGEDAGKSDDSGPHMHIGYHKLVIATGATPRTLDAGKLDGVHVLRTMSDCLAIRESLDRGGPLVVVGAGFIGAEVASSARARGIPVTLVEVLPAPMERALGREVGGLLRDLHESNGTEVLCGVAVDGFEGDTRVRGVRLDNGRTIPADTVVVGIGVTPNTSWLHGSGVMLDDGVVCDQFCAAVNVDDVAAIGDVARWYDTRIQQHVRVEHWTNATEQAYTVAHNIVDPDDRRVHRALPYFWSDQYGTKIQLIGYCDPAAQVTTVKSSGPKFRAAAVYHHGDELRAAVMVNWSRALGMTRVALQDNAPVGKVLDKLAERIDA
ncbi:FAD/NAD(P)-binding oxidoreductase [Mycobacterium intracellulare]|uniref:NAD(P)/FAD-dependent oxidoreductase n=1 Tax=Mycobacterium intracellulare TaxID=1767 RepID=UPI0033465C07